jgi:hypothetical protein
MTDDLGSLINSESVISVVNLVYGTIDTERSPLSLMTHDTFMYLLCFLCIYARINRNDVSK